MSAPNFYNKNASKIFATECNEDYEFDDLRINILSEVKTAYVKNDRYTNNNGRYGGLIFGEIVKEFGKWKVTIDLIARDGYYSGINFDWDLEIEDLTNGDSFEYQEAPPMPKVIQKYIASEIEKLEKVYTNFTTPLICKGIFSNGEAVYELANKVAEKTVAT